jgi:hypothetical protein
MVDKGYKHPQQKKSAASGGWDVRIMADQLRLRRAGEVDAARSSTGVSPGSSEFRSPRQTSPARMWSLKRVGVIALAAFALAAATASYLEQREVVQATEVTAALKRQNAAL